MPKVVESIPSRVYSWDEWSDGKTRKFVKGVDFDCEPRSFGNAARKAANAASRANRLTGVDVMIRGEAVYLTFRLRENVAVPA